MYSHHCSSVGRPPGARSLALAAALIVVTLSFLVSPLATASPGQPDRDMHPYVGMLVFDLGDGRVYPYCHVTLISSTKAVTAHHCAPTGSEVSFTLDNPVLIPAQIHTGTVRMGGNDFGNHWVDIAIIDLHEPVELPRYAQIPMDPISYGPGFILDFVTYIANKQSGNHPPPWHALFRIPGGLPSAKYMQNEPAQVEFDRNLTRTTPKQGNGRFDTTKVINTTTASCYGHSGSPIFPSGTDTIAGVMSYSSSCNSCTGADTYFARTDGELAMGILTDTVEPPVPPPPPTYYPPLVTGPEAPGTLTFPATILANSEYAGSVAGFAPATQFVGEVVQDEWVVFPISVSKRFDSFAAALSNEYTSGNDDLDLYLTWYVDGEPGIVFLGSAEWYTSDEGVVLTSDWLSEIPNWAKPDDPYDFEIWVYGWDVEGASSVFTLFTSEIGGDNSQGEPIIVPTSSGLLDPHITIEMSWSGLDPFNHMYLGWIQHFIDGIPEPYMTTVVSIDIP